MFSSLPLLIFIRSFLRSYYYSTKCYVILILRAPFSSAVKSSICVVRNIFRLMKELGRIFSLLVIIYLYGFYGYNKLLKDNFFRLQFSCFSFLSATLDPWENNSTYKSINHKDDTLYTWKRYFMQCDMETDFIFHNGWMIYRTQKQIVNA